jgi:ABC-type polysaccharide/polyol phosphate export permease
MTATPESLERSGAPSKRRYPLGDVLSSWQAVWKRRRLIRYLARADLHKKGSDTLLGNLWWVVDPLLQMMVYVVLVDFIFQKKIPDYPLFIFCAILPWKWYTTTVYDAMVSVSSSYGLIKQVSFPKLILPVASTMAAVMNFVFGLIPLFTLEILFYRERLTWFILDIPLIAAVQFVFGMATAVAVACLNVYFRDIGNVARHALRLWFYLSPGLYALETIQSTVAHNRILSTLVSLNPWTWIFSSYRNVIYEGIEPYFLHLGVILLGSLVFLVLSTKLFRRLEPGFAKVL